MPKMTRRTFMWLSGGAGAALAAEPGRKLVNKLVPYVNPPEQTRPGEWSHFATTCRECPAGCGMMLWHRDGRVTKAEGNPAHPVNAGALCPRGQSSVQGLYDPDRIKGVWHRPRGGRKRERSWEEALREIAGSLPGRSVAVLSSLQTGSLSEVMRRFTATFGSKRFLLYEPFHYETLKKAHGALFGLPLVPDYRIDRCRFVISFAADFLESWISPVAYASRFGEFRGAQTQGRASRMAYVGPRFSMTAANADDFLQVPPGYERAVAVAMLKVIIDRGWSRRDLSAVRPAIDRVLQDTGAIPGVSGETVTQFARLFVEAEGSVALAGPVGSSAPQALETAVACALLNYAAGRIGETVDFSRPHALSNAATEEELQRFFGTLGPSDILFIHDTNPVYTRPGTLDLIRRAGLVVFLGTMPDETAEAADWVLPIDSPLEAWGEYAPYPGVNGLLQPGMARITDSMSAGDIFLSLARRAGRPLSRPGFSQESGFRGWLAARWDEVRRAAAPGRSRDGFWTDALRGGGYWQESVPAAEVRFNAGAAGMLTGVPRQSTDPETVELWPWASVMLYDGRTANRGWIQETPDPVTSIAWGNWIDIHPRRASALKLANGEVAELTTAAGTLRAPVRITDEVAENVAAIAFGQGHQAMGRNARKTGANAFLLLGAPESGRIFPSCRIRRTGERRENDPTYTVPTREQHGRRIVQWVSQSLLRMMKPGEGEELFLPLPEGYRKERDFYPKREYLRHRWAMVIDLHRCIGCGACTVACYAENNIPVMGKKQVARQLEMAWLRVVPYRKEPGPGLRLAWLPMLCQHCDTAPCEPVCPVYASVHNEEGLNAQVYNRCIGTRYCSNNCPYKVRRFNWLDTKWEKPLDMQLNPEVTVRSRGVMEKCTFCVQRIRQAEYRAMVENRDVRDGEVVPACAQTCPTKVFTFGDLLDPQSQVSRLIRTDPRRYQVLKELNTKPAVVYLRRVENDVDVSA
ncbi:4Fe-4S dicluster domain-containing protein [Geobacter sp. DSM 9736]|uniref:4Fe-4S dicluster domain-containing protein n=1 Tax=Geobacter sp. DSM 9736 TaxID=1277350 RepID=UPI000B51487F|nr:4Fe-4S dicluster domain-containing protein [Geobacter sp. DSM 9736]SNB46690.1 prokaryotic molybdopterin-containing oxidoreductase family, iron-sulfur binding subunit [Geobacter sp. DSM 9736]